MKSDFEVYIGVYLVAVWFIGWSHVIGLIVYWQILRIKYHLSPLT